MSFSGEVKAELSAKKRHSKDERRLFLRDVFLRSGSVSDPEKSYHFEIVCATKPEAERILTAIRDFGLDAKTVERKGHTVVYLKEAEQIADMLKILGASKSLLSYENVRIVKEMRNSVNRQVNCETANLGKTIGAAVRQVSDIRFIEERQGLSSLPENLREMAEIRLLHPEASLPELGTYFTPPIGKSGVNHRLRKISEIAEDLR